MSGSGVERISVQSGQSGRGPALLEKAFAGAKARGRAAMIPFVTAGDPSLETTAAILREMDRAGADVLEVGIPFSDPLADGPVIQAASTRALAGGVTLDGIFGMLKQAVPGLKAPVVLLVYVNSIFSRGVDCFLTDCEAAGVAGLIVPDLPPEEAGEYREAARRYGVATITFAAPTSTPERLRLAAEYGQGFIYCVSVTGVTGERREISPEVEPMLDRVRQYTDLPLAVGFGISGPEQARAVARYADGVIVGSAVVRAIREAVETGRGGEAAAAGELVRRLKEAAVRS